MNPLTLKAPDKRGRKPRKWDQYPEKTLAHRLPESLFEEIIHYLDAGKKIKIEPVDGSAPPLTPIEADKKQIAALEKALAEERQKNIDIQNRLRHLFEELQLQLEQKEK